MLRSSYHTPAASGSSLEVRVWDIWRVGQGGLRLQPDDITIPLSGSASVPSMQSVSGLLYSLYRITLVDEYEYAAMVTVDAVMAPLLCGTFLAASSILCVNLLIALLSDTFQRSESSPGP